MRDFTIKCYKQLIHSFSNHDYKFITFADSVNKIETGRTIILRHDVDKNPDNSLKIARILKSAGVKGSYYFRLVKESYDEKIIKEIALLGHEIGYQYETYVNQHGNIDKAYEEFCINLEKFRLLYPVTTVCMHGSPGSKYDNRDLWSKYDYRKLGIIGEPYYDLNFEEVFYLTDTGRCWDGDKFSVRDKVVVKNMEFTKLRFHSTDDIIKAVDNGKFPDKVMMTFHPQRWTNNHVLWTKEFTWQGLKNQVKKYFFVK